jgi:Kef-type K+ transport system membrane component KefB
LFERSNKSRKSEEDLVHPLVTVLAPHFFVVMGARVNVASLGSLSTWLLVLLFTTLGIAGKYLAGFGGGRNLRSSVIGWGMVPRGEVGFIFVAVGTQIRLGDQPLLTPGLQAALVATLLLTTVVGPVALGRALEKRTRA